MDLMNSVVSLCKRRGIIFPGSEIYGGLANCWDYGPIGVELKNNIKRLWWERFVQRRNDIVGIDASIIMHKKVWEASGHVANFTDQLVECKNCHQRFRLDQLKKQDTCEGCGKQNTLTKPRSFNLLFKTFIGPVEDSASQVYLRPETAQAMFVDYKNIIDTTRISIPFGVAQIGRAFRNEITPGNFIFRTREFEQMEIEYFFQKPKSDQDWQRHFEHWIDQMYRWIEADLGINKNKIHEHEIPENERAHYSKRTVDFEYDFPFGRSELYGLAYRTNFDLKNHEKFSGKDLKYRDHLTGEVYWPHVIEPTWGVDRSVLITLVDGYTEDKKNGKTRVFLKLAPKLAPYKVAVFPLVANKPELAKKAKRIYDTLAQKFMTAWDDRGNIGKRYMSQDEIGTPWCVTIDYDTLRDNNVTIRDRDTTQQIRFPVNELESYFTSKLMPSIA